ncbi:MAG: hypothetical protein V4720_12810 [Pseudomonadota bacterium]
MLGEALGADSSVLLPSGQDFSALHRVQIESSEHAGFTELWLARIADPRADPHSDVRRYQCIPGSSFITEHEFTTERERMHLPYFNEVARPGRREWWAILRAKTGHQSWGLNLYRGGRRGPFGSDEAKEAHALRHNFAVWGKWWNASPWPAGTRALTVSTSCALRPS